MSTENPEQLSEKEAESSPQAVPAVGDPAFAIKGAIARGDSEIPDRLSYNVVLPEFEGPLDLLLFLCKSHELDIVNIPIAFVTGKYLEYLDLMQDMSVDVAAEYLVMAATLCYLKSRELVPMPEAEEIQAEEESGMDPREELIRRLLEYQKYKDAAEKLGARPIEGRNVFGRGMPGFDGPRQPGELAEHSAWKLIEAFADLLKDAGKTAKVHNVVMDRMSVADRINELVDRLDSNDGSFRFDSVVDLSLPDDDLRHQLVVTLLAILEMARLRIIRVLRDEASGTCFIARSASVADRRSVTAREEDHGKIQGQEAQREEPSEVSPATRSAVFERDDGDDGSLDGVGIEGLGLEELGLDDLPDDDEPGSGGFGADADLRGEVEPGIGVAAFEEIAPEEGISADGVTGSDPGASNDGAVDGDSAAREEQKEPGQEGENN